MFQNVSIEVFYNFQHVHWSREALMTSYLAEVFAIYTTLHNFTNRKYLTLHLICKLVSGSKLDKIKTSWCASTILEYVFRTLNIFWRYILTWAGRKYSHSYYNNGIHPIIIFILTHLLTSFRRDDHNLRTISYEIRYSSQIDHFAPGCVDRQTG